MQIKLTSASAMIVATFFIFGCNKQGEVSKSSQSSGGNSPSTITKISDDDRLKIAHYGACSSIAKAIVHLMNNSGAERMMEVRMVRDTAAHQAVIYFSMAADLIRKYPDVLRDEAIIIANKVLEESIMGKTLDGKQLNELRSANGGCAFEGIPTEAITKLMQERRDIYDDLLKEFKQL